ncbi:MASE1 domain-containing protein [Actinopolymorpha pittospori]|uniref:Integral membrane sensor domain MASE1 n=1 Tax=Actinopolymorpha pittospori TaxID=648752 RepID=A0A927MXF9_9ACTN|nr:integral membrane sensor domain MASE1 [Actinopolymorpha pittospori]
MHNRHIRQVAIVGLQNIAVTAAYLVGRFWGLQLFAEGEFTRVLFPAAGIAVAGLMIFGLRVWPGTFLGALLTSETLGRPLLDGVALSLATTATYPVVCALLRRVDFHTQLDRIRDLLALVALAAGVGMIPAAVIRTSVVVLLGTSPPADFWDLTLVTWVSLAMGVLVVTPFLLAIRRMRWPRHVRPLRALEAVALLAGTAALTLAVTMVSPNRQMLFLVFPPLIWAAWRFQLAGSTPSILIVSAIAVYSMFHLPARLATDNDLITLEAFVATASLATLALAVAVSERNRAQDRIANASIELVHALNKLDESARPRQG